MPRDGKIAAAARWAGHEKTKQIAVRLPLSLLDGIERIADARDQTVTEVIRDMLAIGVQADQGHRTTEVNNAT